MSNLSNLTNVDPEVKDSSTRVDARLPPKSKEGGEPASESPDQSKSSVDAIDVTSITRSDYVLSSLAHFHTLQGLFDHTLNKLRAPTTIDDRFLPYVPVFGKHHGTPVLGSDIFIGDVNNGGDTFSGQGGVNFRTWTYHSEVPALVPTLNKCCVKWDTDIVSSIMAAAQSTKERVPTDGVRDVRARPEYVLQDWGVFMTDTIDTTYRTIRTDVFANYMYYRYEAPADSTYETLYIINVGDLRDWLNTHNCPCPLPADTLCLDLSEVEEIEMPDLACLGSKVIINLGKPLATHTVYEGLPAAGYKLVSIGPSTEAARKALNSTYDPQEADLALFLMAIPINIGIITPSAQLRLETHRNTIQEQILNYYCSGCKHKICIPAKNQTDFLYMVQSFRLAKTMLNMKSAMTLGIYGRATPGLTIGADTYGPEITRYLNGFFVSTYVDAISTTPIWIPFEFWIANGADLVLDSDKYTGTVNGRMVNVNCVVPKSYSPFALGQWANSASTNSAWYYSPNSFSYISINNMCQSIITPYAPETLPRFSSLSGTMTASYDPALRPWVVSPVSAGHNNRYLVTRKLGF